MSKMQHEFEDDELSIFILDVWNFLKRQYKNIILIFLFSFTLVIVYLVTRPTLYVSEASLIVGSSIETPDQIKYLYSSEVIITPVNNTTIIKISSTSTDSKDSAAAVEKTIKKIIDKHDELLIDRREQAIKLLKATQNDSKKEFIDLINRSSQLSFTKQVTPITSNTVAYSGLMKKGLQLGLIGSIFLALFVTIGFEFIAKIRKIVKAT
jgi:uncharacterized protein involved in exopolysaccharide biosynthesis